MLHGGITASEQSVVAEYRALVHDRWEGISGDQLEAYWRFHGIGGRRMRLQATDETTPANLSHLISRHGAIIAELAIPPYQGELRGCHRNLAASILPSCVTSRGAAR
jgi:hypothetical protein